MNKVNVWVFFIPARQHVKATFSRVPCVGEFVGLSEEGEGQKFYRVDAVHHSGDPNSQNDGEIFVTEVDYMTEMSRRHE